MTAPLEHEGGVPALLRARAGLSFVPHLRAGLEGGIRRAMRRAGTDDLAAWLAAIRSSPAALDDLLDEVLVGETYFFRDPGQFEWIRGAILPEVRARRGPAAPLRAWSAGCASGEEAYSLAILLEEEGVPRGSWLLGTDLSRAALARAAAATYGEWSLRGDGAARARRWLRRSGERWALDERIRARVAFRRLNLTVDPWPSPATGTDGMDLILCRNVLIYFDEAAVRVVAGRLFDALSDGGWLVAGASDPPLHGHAPFEAVATPAGVVYRRPVGQGEPRIERDFTCHLSLVTGHWSLSPQPADLEQCPVTSDQCPVTSEPSPSEGGEPDPLLAVEAALASGEWAAAADRARALEGDPRAAALRVGALANLQGPLAAEREAARAAARHPLDAELNWLRALLLLDLGRAAEAERAARRAIYLDRALAEAHFLLGAILERRGEAEGARRAYRNAREAAAARAAAAAAAAEPAP